MSFTIENVKSFKIPLATLYLEAQKIDDVVTIHQVLKTVWDFPFATFASFFALISSLFHLIVYLNKDSYIKGLRKGINEFRWYEYSISSSLMISN